MNNDSCFFPRVCGVGLHIFNSMHPIVYNNHASCHLANGISQNLKTICPLSFSSLISLPLSFFPAFYIHIERFYIHTSWDITICSFQYSIASSSSNHNLLMLIPPWVFYLIARSWCPLPILLLQKHSHPHNTKIHGHCLPYMCS